MSADGPLLHKQRAHVLLHVRILLHKGPVVVTILHAIVVLEHEDGLLGVGISGEGFHLTLEGAGHAVDLGKVDLVELGHILHDGLEFQRVEVGHGNDRILTEEDSSSIDQRVTVTRIGVDVRPGRPVATEKARPQEAKREGVDLRDAQQVVDQRATTRTTGRTEQRLLLCEMEHVIHGQEVVLEAQELDVVHLFLDALDVLGLVTQALADHRRLD